MIIGVINTKKGEMRLSQSAATTSDTILFFDDLFDSFNGKKGHLFGIISATSNHLAFWREACNRLRQMEFVEKHTHKPIRRNGPKCLHNWIWTIQGIKYLWSILQNARFSSLNLKYINQDPVENCFGQIRDNGHRNINPSAYQFGTSFVTLIATNLTSRHSLSSNCEDDNGGSSLALLKMFHAAEIASASEEEEKREDIDCTEAAIPNATKQNISIDAQGIINFIRDKSIVKCEECLQQLQNDWLLQNVQQSIDKAEIRFPVFCHEIKVREKLIKLLNAETFLTFDMHCPNLKSILIDKIAHQFILQWCKFVNGILSGKVQHISYSNFIYDEAKRISVRYLRKNPKN